MRSINIEELFPHPHNPRKDLGDLTELAASIKENGVMQNLTVVRNSTANDIYTVVIGHRRLAAAKLAGLESVPCSIVEMNECKQISTMLLENMQRSDLTVCEQAQGFQMMLDLGESVVNIAKQTGFSDTTIRRRVKLLELDADKFKASEARGATLMDYVALNEIEDVQRRNYLLEKIGTSDFKWEFNNAQRAQNSKKNAPLFRKELESFATCITPDMPGSREYVKNLSASDYEPGKLIPKDAGTVKYFFTWNDEYYSSTLYKQSTRKEPTKRPQEEIDRENAIKKAKEDLYSVIKQAYEMRKNFFFNLTVTSKHIVDLLDFYASILLFNTHYGRYDWDHVEEYYKIDELTDDAIMKVWQQDHAKLILITAYCASEDDERMGYSNMGYYGTQFPEFKSNKKLDLIYDFMCKLGYEMSTEEKQLQDGTHVLYAPKTEVDIDDIDDVEDEEEEIIPSCINCRYQFDSEGKCGEKCGTDFKNWEQAENDE